jgi:two-component sensor histidine kinase
VLSVSLISEAFTGAALIFIATTIFVAVNHQRRLGRRLRVSLLLTALGLSSLAVSMMAPIVIPFLNGTIYELIFKISAACIVLAAIFSIWPVVRMATQHRNLLASLSETQLLLLERDNLAAAKTELEKEIIEGSFKLERANRQMRLAILGSQITIFRQDKEHRYSWIFNVPPGTKESDYLGKTDMEVFPADVALTIGEVKNQAMKSGEEQSAEVRVRFPHGSFWYLLRTQPDYDENGDIIGTISCAVDITEQKRHQNRQELLMREVTHRSKNLLAVLQSIVRQTAIRTTDIAEFMAKLTDRLQSIAASHDLLVNDDWSGTSLRKLVKNQLAVASAAHSERVVTSGIDILLTAVAVQNLGFALHELATNAMKCGALSNETGVVKMRWRIVTQRGAMKRNKFAEDCLEFVWEETGGPPIEGDIKEGGFGKMLLERVVGQALGGVVALDFAQSGVVCKMILPVSRVVAGRERDNASVKRLVAAQ